MDSETRVTSDDHLVNEDEVERWLAEKRGDPATRPAPPMRVSKDPEDAWAIINEPHEIVHAYGGAIAWPTKDGGVASAYVGFAILDGEIWSTTTKGRGKTYAMLRDPRAMLVVVSADRQRSTTVYGRVELSNNDVDVTRFAIGFSRYRSNGAMSEIGPGIASFDSPGRYAIRFIAERFVTRLPA